MANFGSLTVALALESAQFMAGMKQAASQTQKTQAEISSALSLARKAVGAFGGALTVDALIGATQRAFDYADAIVDLADRTGITTKTLQEFRFAAQMSGSSVENADAAIDKFAKNLGNASSGNKAMAATMAELGITTDSVDVAVRQAIEGISKLPSTAQKNAAAVSLFGKSAADLTVVLSGGIENVDELSRAADKLGIVLEDSVLRNAGQVNDKLDTMKMIMDAQFANAIVTNADALMTFANAAIQAGAAAANFFASFDTRRLMSVANGVNMGSDVGYLLEQRLKGKSLDQVSGDARAELKKTGSGRSALHAELTERYNANIRAGRNKNDMDMQAILAEREDIARMEAASRIGMKPMKPTPGARITKPTGKTKPTKTLTDKTDAELEYAWMTEMMRTRGALGDAQADLENTPQSKREARVNSLRDDFILRQSEIKNDTGTDKEVREGKKRLNKLQADQLGVMEKELYDARYDLAIREERQELADQALLVAKAANDNDLDLLRGEQDRARSSMARRDVALRIVDLEFQQERLCLEAITHSETATKAEKDIAHARLNILDKLKGQAVDRAKDQTAGPGRGFLDSLPNTAGEINDEMERVQVEGLKNLEDGLLDVVKGTGSVKDAFKSMADSIIDQLLRIAVQQMIIKPIASALFGDSGGSSSGGLFGSIIGSIIKGSTGARANGGMSQPGRYLVGERGAEYVDIGAPANVVPNSALRTMKGANDNVNISFGPITSNDPAAIRAGAMEALTVMLPSIRQQAADHTLARINRPKM